MSFDKISLEIAIKSLEYWMKMLINVWTKNNYDLTIYYYSYSSNYSIPIIMFIYLF